MGLRGRPSREGNGQRPGGWALFSLSLLFPLKRKALERRKRERGSGKKFERADNFPGLTKMCLFRENRKGHDLKI